jgi:hypothetical protein
MLDKPLAQALEAAAEHNSALIAARLSQPVANEAVEVDFQWSFNQVKPADARSIGAETLSLRCQPKRTRLFCYTPRLNRKLCTSNSTKLLNLKPDLIGKRKTIIDWKKSIVSAGSG